MTINGTTPFHFKFSQMTLFSGHFQMTTYKCRGYCCRGDFGPLCIGIGKGLSMEQAFLGVCPLGQFYVNTMLTLLKSFLAIINYYQL